jgi:hypothetical protein
MTFIFGIADIFAGLIFLAGFYQIDIPRGMMMALGIYLILKGLIFIVNFFSLIDIGAGVLLAFGLISSVHPFVLIGLAGFLCLKGLISLFTFS